MAKPVIGVKTIIVSGSDGPNNAVWPFQSVKDKTLDKKANLPPPQIDEVTGEWILSSLDVECISVGAGILGCGGGGDPNIGRTMASEIMKHGKQIRIVDPLKIKLNGDQFGLASTVAFMGAPSDANEESISGQELTQSLHVMQNIIASGLCTKENDYGRKEKDNIKLSKEKLENGHDIWVIDVSTLPQYKQIPLANRITGLMPIETGGINSFAPLVAGANLGLPILDADGIGRAYPELQMFLPFINGLHPFPSCVAGENEKNVAISHASSAKDLEDFFRIKCAEMGICAICIPPMTLSDVLDNCVLHSLSHAWQLGRAICRAKQSPCNVAIEYIVTQQQGLILLTGKVVYVHLKVEGGFTSGYFIIKGTGSFSKYTIQILIKNENFVVRKINDDGSIGKVPAVTPDLITVVDSDTGCPITTEHIASGLSVSVLVLPADPKLLTKKVLPVVGPQAFQLNVQYHKPIPLSDLN